MNKQTNTTNNFSVTLLCLLMIFASFVFVMGSPVNNVQASGYSKASPPSDSDQILEKDEEETTNTHESSEETTTTTEIIAPTPPITFNPNEETTQTSRQTSKDNEPVETTRVTTRERNGQEDDNNSKPEPTTTSQKIATPTETTKGKPHSSKNGSIIEAGKLVVVKKDAIPLNYLVSKFATQLYKNSNIIQTFYYQSAFLIRHLLIIPDADILGIVDHQILRWLNYYIEYSIQSETH
ncbi:hypothetical protein [Facklamia miroungae]|uniref:Uncharacterized protein n=1 Tax=Facklamia miroungae TaxID=120956 RepID=A0A1G7S5X5_9LACT|nr:hypothetical protein [Facklamia miroungae]NKZ29177.1 hypothetical protein [Facklamia miroungae]SDG17580.1 hypothetical protein SAMN05421791_103278 [Facklamia miroungae]